MNPQDLRASEMQKRRVDDDDDEDSEEELDFKEFLVEIEVCIKESYANLKIEKEEMKGKEMKKVVKKEPYRVISKHIQIVDIPGIEDGQHAVPIKAYIEQNKERIIPVVLINLTSGAFHELV